MGYNLRMSERRKPTVAFWCAVAAGLLVAYLLSIGPAIWLDSRGLLPGWLAETLGFIYVPLDWLAERFEWFDHLFNWYDKLWRHPPTPDSALKLQPFSCANLLSVA